MANILIWMSPEPGHILPTLKVAQDLTRRGHTVIYQVPRGQQADIQAFGFSVVGFFTQFGDIFGKSIYHAPHSASAYYRLLHKHYPGAAYFSNVRQELLNAVRLVRADLVIVDGTFHRLLQLNLGEHLPRFCPLIRLYTHLPYQHISQDGLGEETGAAVFLSPRHFEIPSLIWQQAFYTEAGRVPQRYMALRSIYGDIPGSATQADNIVYCSLGSQAEQYPASGAIIHALIKASTLVRRFHFVIAAGNRESEFGRAHPNATVVSTLSLGILQHAAAMVLHGGFGSIKDCIYSAVPMLVLPQKWDQPLNATRVVHHGLGLTLTSEDATPENIAERITALTQMPTVRRNLKQMRRYFTREDDACPTAALVDKMLECR